VTPCSAAHRNGKALLTVPNGAQVLPQSRPGGGKVWLAAISSDGRMLVFPLEELPELGKGKGNKIMGIPRIGFAMARSLWWR